MPTCLNRPRQILAYKPPPWVEVDWSHPQARSLAMAFLFNHAASRAGTGSQRNYARHGFGGTLGGSPENPVLEENPRFGLGFNFDGTNDRISGTHYAELSSTTEQSILLGLRPDVLAIGRRVFSVRHATQANGSYFFAIGPGVSSDCFFGHDPLDLDARQVAHGMSVANDYQVACCWKSGERKAYVNGKDLNATTAVTGVGYGTAAGYALGMRVGNADNFFDGKLFYVYSWTRYLSQGDVQSFLVDPYQFFKPIRPKRFLPIAPPAEGGHPTMRRWGGVPHVRSNLIGSW